MERQPTPEEIEAARNWKPERQHMTATDYYKRYGVAPKGQTVFIGGKVYDEAGEVRQTIAPKDPNRLGVPKDWGRPGK